MLYFSTLYADVKEPAPGQCPGREVCTLEFLPANKLKTVVNASFYIFRAGGGGPDWTRTSDPALIKRML